MSKLKYIQLLQTPLTIDDPIFKVVSMTTTLTLRLELPSMGVMNAKLKDLEAIPLICSLNQKLQLKLISIEKAFLLPIYKKQLLHFI